MQPNQDEKVDAVKPTGTADVIIAVARQIFFEKGYEKATTREISERSGISKAALYHHFKSKEEILFRIINQASDELINNMRQALAVSRSQEGPLKDKVAAVSHEYMRTFFSNLDSIKILLHDIEYLNPEFKNIILQKEKDNVHQLRKYITDLQQGGHLKAHNPTALTFILIGMMHWLYFWFDPQGEVSLNEMNEIIADVFVDGAGESGAE
jgi:AcrR family transcriptional regulator